MRYLVTARVRKGRESALLRAIRSRTLGRGSVAGDEYLRDMASARRLASGDVKWVETCFCATPLEEERPYWEAFFDLTDIRDAHARAAAMRTGPSPGRARPATARTVSRHTSSGAVNGSSRPSLPPRHHRTTDRPAPAGRRILPPW
jgi:hypothetical protein